MRTFAITAVLAVAAGLGFAGRADAQPVVIGTGGTSHASLGYYSPYPGALYSPFRPAPPTIGGPVGGAYRPNWHTGPTYFAPNYSTGGFTVVRTYNPGFYAGPGYGSGYGRGGRRW